MRRYVSAFLHLCLSVVLAGLVGCASVAVSAVGGGIAYTVTNIAYKTVNYPLPMVEDATHRALKRMAIREAERAASGNDIEITAAAGELNITITLSRVTSQTTRISVDARKNFFLKDRATAAEIIDQAVRLLDAAKGDSL